MEIFKYDSPFSQMLLRIADVIILNLLYLVCCIPVFTMGAAQAGMYTAAKVMLDKEDDTSLTKAFFRGFKAGFGTVTAGWGIATLVLAVVVYLGVAGYMLGASIWPTILGAVVIIVYQCAIPLFHSKFGNNLKMLLRNTLYFVIGFPLPCIGAAILIYLPVLAFAFLDLYTWMALTPIWLMFYYSTAMIFGYVMAKKPFETLMAEYKEEE